MTIKAINLLNSIKQTNISKHSNNKSKKGTFKFPMKSGGKFLIFATLATFAAGGIYIATKSSLATKYIENTENEFLFGSSKIIKKAANTTNPTCEMVSAVDEPLEEDESKFFKKSVTNKPDIVEIIEGVGIKQPDLSKIEVTNEDFPARHAGMYPKVIKSQAMARSFNPDYINEFDKYKNCNQGINNNFNSIDQQIPTSTFEETPMSEFESAEKFDELLNVMATGLDDLL